MLVAWGAIVALTGGIDTRVFGIVIRSRDPLRPLAAALVLLLLQAVFFRRELARDLDRAAGVVRAGAPAIAALLALAVGAHGAVFGTFSVGGSDAYGYVNQAYDWLDGALPRPIPLTERLPFDASDRMQAPLGYREGTAARTIVPTYAPGLPLVMAVALAIFGACGPFFVTPVSAALFVWLTFRLGVRAGGPDVGLVAAFLVSISPVVLYQAVWPMSDVPAAALWTGAALFTFGSGRLHALGAGILTALGLLIRPNLLPAAILLSVPLVLHGSARDRVVRGILFGAPLAAVVLFTGWLNTLWFGSPLNSGYGAASELYAWANVVPNLRLYGAWLWKSQTGWMLLALLPLVPSLRHALDRRTLAVCLLLLVGVLGCYVSYAQFEVWWYLRFLLPAFGALMVLTASGLLSAARAATKPFGAIGAAVVLLLIAAQCLSFAGSEGVFGGVRGNERRYAAVASYAATLPPNAALVAVQHGGSLRFYSGRLTVRFDVLEAPRSQDLVQALERAGYHPFLVIDDAETPDVRARFGIPEHAPLPWPIRARMRELGGVTVYDLGTSPAGDGPVALEATQPAWCGVPRRRS